MLNHIRPNAIRSLDTYFAQHVDHTEYLENWTLWKIGHIISLPKSNKSIKAEKSYGASSYRSYYRWLKCSSRSCWLSYNSMYHTKTIICLTVLVALDLTERSRIVNATVKGDKMDDKLHARKIK